MSYASIVLRLRFPRMFLTLAWHPTETEHFPAVLRNSETPCQTSWGTWRLFPYSSSILRLIWAISHPIYKLSFFLWPAPFNERSDTGAFQEMIKGCCCQLMTICFFFTLLSKSYIIDSLSPQSDPSHCQQEHHSCYPPSADSCCSVPSSGRNLQ